GGRFGQEIAVRKLRHCICCHRPDLIRLADRPSALQTALVRPPRQASWRTGFGGGRAARPRPGEGPGRRIPAAFYWHPCRHGARAAWLANIPLSAFMLSYGALEGGKHAFDQDSLRHFCGSRLIYYRRHSLSASLDGWEDTIDFCRRYSVRYWPPRHRSRPPGIFGRPRN